MNKPTTVVTVPHNKDRALKLFIGVFVVGFVFYIVLTLAASLTSITDERIAAFLSGQLVITISGTLYGFAVIFFRKTSLKDAFNEMKRSAVPLVKTMLLVVFFTLIGYGCLAIPGIVATLLLFFVPFVVAIEKKGSFQALKRSCKLFTYVWLSLIATIVAFYLLFLLVTVFFSFAFAENTNVAQVMSGTVLFPLETYAFYRLYMRARKKESEGIKNG